MKQILNGIKIVFQDKNSLRITTAGSLAIGYVFYWLLTRVTTIPAFFQMVRDGEFGQYSVAYAVIYWVTTLATVGIFGISVSILVWLWRHSLLGKAAGGGNAAGAFIGALGSACPVCGAFLLQALGVGAGMSAFPLQGLEFKFVSLGLIAGSTAIAARRVNRAVDCDECEDITKHQIKPAKTKLVVLPLEKLLVAGLTGLFLVNQLLITQIAAISGLPTGNVAKLFGVKTGSATVIIAPKLNPDGKTTSLVEQPTISEVSANPDTGNALSDAKVVMIATGKPFYAPDDIAFDDPINAQKKWGAYEQNIKLDSALEARYQKLISTMVCSYCCGGPTSVTTINRCGCAHAKAARGFFKFMLQNYGDKYSDDQLLGEGHRWYAIWYPKGMLEDYLLATGKSDALPHKTHGGAGSDGRHGL